MSHVVTVTDFASVSAVQHWWGLPGDFLSQLLKASLQAAVGSLGDLPASLVGLSEIKF